MRARAPASTSNLGPGFDVLGLALQLYVDVEITPAPTLLVRSSGEGSTLPADGSHLAARVASSVVGHDHLEITVRSSIPSGRGLGSSAALAAAAAAAAGAEDPLSVAARFDGHGENAAASVLGGLVAASFVAGAVVAWPLPLDERIGLVLVVPDRELPTKTARSVLPATVAFGDATFNLGRMGLLLAGLADSDALVAQAGDDRLYVEHRTGLFPEAPQLLDALRDAGATVACWSGAGPSLLGICRSPEIALQVERRVAHVLGSVGLSGRTMTLRPDRTGLVVDAS